jgi:hypothetical protein
MNNLLIDEVLTSHQIKRIYSYIRDYDNIKYITPHLGQINWGIEFLNDITATIEALIQDHYGNCWKLGSPMFSRYTRNSGYIPKLPPHLDTFDSHKLTFDLQLKSNINWPIFVDGNRFVLKNNQGLVFHGTREIHWRENIELSDEDFVDSLYCQFENSCEENNIDMVEYNNIKEKAKNMALELGISVEPILIDRV